MPRLAFARGGVAPLDLRDGDMEDFKEHDDSQQQQASESGGSSLRTFPKFHFLIEHLNSRTKKDFFEGHVSTRYEAISYCWGEDQPKSSWKLPSPEWACNPPAESIYWIRGKAGSGKTTLLNHVMEESEAPKV